MTSCGQVTTQPAQPVHRPGRDDLLVQLLPLRRPACRWRRERSRSTVIRRNVPIARQRATTMAAPMELTYDAEAEAFRAEIREWLADNLPAAGSSRRAGRVVEHVARGAPAVQRGVAGASCSPAGGSAPRGRPSTAARGCRRCRASCSPRSSPASRRRCGPTSSATRSSARRSCSGGARSRSSEFLPKILRGEMRWCQGFSEPDSGSDLASLKTSAVLDGDEWVINGQKVWTTQGDDADYCFLLTRTDPTAPEAPGHLLPARADAASPASRCAASPSPTARPSSARCSSPTPAARPTTSSAASTTAGRSPTRRWRSSAGSRRRPATGASRRSSGCSSSAATRAAVSIADPIVRQRLAEYYTKIQILRINGLRTLSAQLDRQRKDPASAPSARRTRCSGRRCTSGRWSWPSTSTAPTRCWSTPARRRARGPARCAHERRARLPVSPMMSAFFFSRSETIWGGTSQIQRNIVGERVLGLPRKPQRRALHVGVRRRRAPSQRGR